MRNSRIARVFVFLALAATCCAASAQTFNVRDYGAKGDGMAKDTAAIQKAIDACSVNGGGTVFLPAGTYLSGSIFLKSNVDFYLQQGATLLGSPDFADYNASDVCPQNAANIRDFESSKGAHLILCIEQQNVAVRGPGRVDGNSMKFIVDENGVPYPGQDKIPNRPSQMLYFVESQNVRIQDVELVDSPYWTTLLHGCENVFIRGVKIKNRRIPHTHNGDGIDLDCCERVSISDCQIDTADDCITFRADDKDLKKSRPCRFISVSNCTLSTPCNCMRFGVGDGKVSDVVVDNVVIEGARTAFNFVSSWTEDSKGTDISGIRISNVRVNCAIFVHAYYKHAKTTSIDNISFDGISGVLRPMTNERDEKFWGNETKEIALIQGAPGHALRNFRFANVQLDVAPGSVWRAEYVDGLELNNFTIVSCDQNEPAAIVLKGASNLQTSGRVVPETDVLD